VQDLLGDAELADVVLLGRLPQLGMVLAGQAQDPSATGRGADTFSGQHAPWILAGSTVHRAAKRQRNLRLRRWSWTRASGLSTCSPQLLQRGHAGEYTGDDLRGNPARLCHRTGAVIDEFSGSAMSR
jgi:hypothetical protein